MSDARKPDAQDTPDAVRSRNAARHRPPTIAELRREAEERLESLQNEAAEVHELRVQQIELEMQNDELRRSQVELDASRAFYAEHYDFAPLGYCTIDASGAFLRANLAASTILGVPRSRLVRHRFSHSVAKADLLVWHAVRARIFGPLGSFRPGRPGDVETCELRMGRPDGTGYWAHLVLTVGDEDGVPVCHVVLSDISERKRTEEALRASEEQFRAIATYTVDWETWFGTDGKIKWLNPAVERITGYSPAAFVAMPDPIRTLVVAEDRDLFAAALEAALSGTRGDSLEFRCVARDGSRLWLGISWQPIFDARGGPLGVRTSARDITMRKRTEAALRASEADLREAQRIAHAGSWAVDLATGVVTWSDEMLRIFGLPPGSPVPPFADHARFFSPEAFALVSASIEATMATGEPFSSENDVLRPDGTTRHVVASGEAIRDASGVIAAVRGVMTDVTELREARTRLEQAQRAETVGRLAAGVAHDFNNQLTAIGGYAEFLATSLAADDPRRDDVEAIRQAGERAAVLTHRLLAFGRRQMLRPTVVDPGEVAAGLATMLRSLVPAGVALALPAGPAGALVRIDRAGLEDAIVNLVLNARDAMPAEGTLAISTEAVEIESDDPRLPPAAMPGSFVRITVTDTGTGIDPAILPHILEPFFTTKPFGQGSGLGLSSVDGFVAQSGGFLSVESEVGTGSSVSVHLPRTTAAPVAAPPRTVRPVPVGGRETILLVDDEPGVLAVTARLLRELGYTVLEASDPAAALAIAESGAAPDLLLTDVVMPGMKGRELAAQLTDRYPDLPVLFMSGYDPETIFGDRLLEHGLQFLSKPVNRATLAARVRKLLDGRPGRSA